MELFHTVRLSVRRITSDDLETLYTVYSDPEGARWVDDGEPISRPDCERWLDITLNNYETRGYGMFAIELTESGETIGFIGIVHPGNQPAPEIKYSFQKAHWGRGYATEAVAGTLKYGSSELGLKHFIATVHPEHAVSQRVLAKAGMQKRELVLEDDGKETQVFSWDT